MRNAHAVAPIAPRRTLTPSLRACVLAALISVVPIVLDAAMQASTAPLYEQRFTRGTGAPKVLTAIVSIKNFQPPFTLHVVNGPAGGPHVSSASIWLNGEPFLKPSDFSRQFATKSIPVSLSDPTEVRVELKGDPGSALEIRIEGTPAPEPLVVSYEEARRVSQAIAPAAGGEIALSDSRGRAFTLEIPPGALPGVASQMITVTPISAIDNLPAPLRFTAGVRLEPHGLAFSRPARLRVFVPDLTDAPGLAAMYRAGADRGYHFYPIGSVSRETSTVTLWLSSFSEISLVVQQILANCTLQGSCATSTCQPYEIYQHAATCALQPVVDCQLTGSSCPTTTPEFVTVMTEWHQQVVMAAINSAQIQSEFERAAQELLRWTSPLQGLGVEGTEPFRTMIETARSTLSQRLCARVTDLSQQCSAAEACSKRPLMQEGLNLIAFAQDALAVAGFDCAEIGASFCSNWASVGAESIDMITPPITLRQGESLQVAVKLLNAMHEEISKPVTWDTGDASVATVSSTGLVTAVAPGATLISAKVDCALAMVSITVEGGPPPTQLYVGECVWFTIENAATPIAWSSGPTLSCGPNDSLTARCEALQEGEATVTAVEANGRVTRWSVTVGPVVASASLTPATTNFYLPWDLDLYNHDRETLYLHATSPRGCEFYVYPFTCETWCAYKHPVSSWAVDRPSVSLDGWQGSAVVRPVSAGTAVVSGTVGGLTRTATVNVHEAPLRIRLSPMPAFVSPSAPLQLTAVAEDRNGNPVTGCAFSWSVLDPGVLSVDSSGIVTALGPGTAFVTAELSGQCPPGNPYSNEVVSGATRVWVVEATGSPTGSLGIRVHPEWIFVGSIAYVMPTWFDPAGNAITSNGQYALTSLTPDIGVFEFANRFRGIAGGTAVVEATTNIGSYGGFAQYATARKSIAVTPASALNVTAETASLTVGSTARLTADLRDANGVAIVLASDTNPLGAPITWSTNDPAVATIAPQPVEGTSPNAWPTISPVVVTGVSAGIATITASGGGLQRSATVTVSVGGSEPAAITITPTTATIGVGQTVQLQAVVTDAGGNPIPDAQVAWTAEPQTVATVSVSGLVTGVTAGSAVVTAASGNVHTSATITVQPSASGTTISGTVHYSPTEVTVLKVELITSDYKPLETTTIDAFGRYQFENVAPGAYHVCARSAEIAWCSPVTVGTTPTTVDIYVPKKITLSSPANGSTLGNLHPTLTWEVDPEAVNYSIQINETSGWAVVETALIGAVTTYNVQAELRPGTSYTWGVDAWDERGVMVGQTLQPFTFTIAGPNPAGGALAFNGVNSLVTVPHDASLSLQDLTIEAWVNLGDPAFFPTAPVPPFNRQTLVSKGRSFGNYTLSALSNRSVEFVIRTAGGNYSASGGTLSAGVWTHVAVTYASATGTTRIYVNGSPVASATGGPVPIANTDALTIGALADTDFFDGVMDEVRIWNLVRSDAEITQDYNRSVDPAAPGLVAYWKFDESGGQTVVTATGNNNSGVLGANATVASDDPARVASAAPIMP